MTCKEAVFSEDVLDYIVEVYRGEDYILPLYNPVCYMSYDSIQGVVYQEPGHITSETIEKYGFSAIPNLYGLMSEEALEASGVSRIRRQPYLDLYGQGVLIGFVDTGIDYTHEAFRSADGRTRIVSIWDQSVVEGDGTVRFPYGQVYEREDINRALESENPFDIVPSRDANGHGTFLAGVAAGEENRAEGFSGVAPLSELIMVKCKQAKKNYRKYYGVPENVDAFQENDIMAGVAYIQEVAQREGKPVIICLGLGTNMGSHSGGTNLSVFMERYNAVSRMAMILSAGNEGNAKHHHAIRVRNDVVNINVEQNIDGFMAQLWWLTPGSLELSLTSPRGETVQGIRALSGERYSHRFSPEDTVVDIYFGVAQELTRQQVVVFRFQSARAGIWKIGVNAAYDTPTYDIWLPIREFLPTPVEFLQPDPDLTICNPSTATNLLTISAYDPGEGSLYLQASRGFTPLGAIKPEVVAPGVNIVGPFPGNRYGTMSGTGVAAAFAAGVGALFMQQYRSEYVNGFTMREIFIRGATPRGIPYPNTEWGYGIINAYESLVGDS